MKARMVSALMTCLPEIMNLIEECLGDSEYLERDINYVRVSVEEIFTNIVSYAYADWENGKIEISCGFLDEEMRRFQICFKDWGKPYNPLEKPNPDFEIPFDDRPIGGLGIFMIKTFMDHVEYQYANGCNCLKIEKIFE